MNLPYLFSQSNPSLSSKLSKKLSKNSFETIKFFYNNKKDDIDNDNKKPTYNTINNANNINNNKANKENKENKDNKNEKGKLVYLSSLTRNFQDIFKEYKRSITKEYIPSLPELLSLHKFEKMKQMDEKEALRSEIGEEIIKYKRRSVGKVKKEENALDKILNNTDKEKRLSLLFSFGIFDMEGKFNKKKRKNNKNVFYFNKENIKENKKNKIILNPNNMVYKIKDKKNKLLNYKKPQYASQPNFKTYDFKNSLYNLSLKNTKYKYKLNKLKLEQISNNMNIKADLIKTQIIHNMTKFDIDWKYYKNFQIYKNNIVDK